jgi:uncharacterized protein
VEYTRGLADVDAKRIGILGSSFGGATCVLKASKDPGIVCVSPWATPHMLDESEDDKIDEIMFKETLYTDFAQYDILSAAEKVSRALVIHGGADEVVPCHEGEAIFERLREPKRLEIIEGADHVFSLPAHRDRAINLALEWFGRYMTPG